MIASAKAKHPISVVADAKVEASRHAIDRQKADGLPQVKLRGGIEGEHAFADNAGRESASASLRETLPLFDGGKTAARVEQARHINRSLEAESRGVRDRLRAGALTAWSGLAAARERIAAERTAEAENKKAAAGLTDEVRLGQRSIIDLLDARRELVSAQVRVVAGERELLVAAHALRSAAGLLAAPDKGADSRLKSHSASGAWSTRTVAEKPTRAKPAGTPTNR